MPAINSPAFFVPYCPRTKNLFHPQAGLKARWSGSLSGGLDYVVGQAAGHHNSHRMNAASNRGVSPSIAERTRATTPIPSRKPIVIPTDITDSNRVFITSLRIKGSLLICNLCFGIKSNVMPPGPVLLLLPQPSQSSGHFTQFLPQRLKLASRYSASRSCPSAILCRSSHII